MLRSDRRYLTDADGNEDAITLELNTFSESGPASGSLRHPSSPHQKSSQSLRGSHRSPHSLELFPEETAMRDDLDGELRLSNGYIDIPDPREFNRTAASIQSPWKRRCYLLMEDPSSSRAAFYMSVFVVVMILASVVIASVETIPRFRAGETPIWFAIETTVVILLAIEVALRIFAHSDVNIRLIHFLLSPLTIIDVSVVFFYILAYILGSDTTYIFRISILRVFRLLRVFRVYRHSSLLQLSIEVMIIATKRSTDALSALLFFMVMTIIIFSSVLYFAERGVWDEERHMFLTSDGLASQFDSIPAVFWFVIVTITTTGYGDMVPQTFIGKLVAFPAMMIGVLLIALPSIIIGRHFTVVWEAMKRKQRRARHRMNNTSIIHDDDEDDDLHSDEDKDESMNETERLRQEVSKLTDICHQNQIMLQQLLEKLNNNNDNK